MSTVDPAGPAANAISSLWWVMLGGSVLIFILVVALLALAFLRPKWIQAGRSEIRLWIISLGIGFPMAVLAALLAYGLVAGEQLLPRSHSDVINVYAEARLSAWEFGYADRPGLKTDNTLHIPVGLDVDVAVTTVDVVHSFWVPRLAGKVDAVPGHVNVLRIKADRPGSYSGLSAEFSGPGYDSFTFTVIAHDQEGWARFLRQGAS